MTGEEAQQRTVEGELVLAQECLREARYALEGGFFRLTRSRAYYACFHAATAVFLARNRSYRRHTGLLAAVDADLVKTGVIPKACSTALRRLYQSRLRSDYGDVSPVSKVDAAQAVADAEEILKLLIPLASC
jgi:uncharacterized protein (UPF0332 family)